MKNHSSKHVSYFSASNALFVAISCLCMLFHPPTPTFVIAIDFLCQVGIKKKHGVLQFSAFGYRQVQDLPSLSLKSQLG